MSFRGCALSLMRQLTLNRDREKTMRIAQAVIAIACLMLVPMSLAAQDESGDGDEKVSEITGFVGADWGTSKDKIIEKHGKPDTTWSGEVANALVYEDTLMQLPAKRVYILIDEKFVRGKYMIDAYRQNEDMYFQDYEQLKKALTKKYGEPDKDDRIWLKPKYKKHVSLGTGLSLGYVSQFTDWKIGDSMINLALYEDGGLAFSIEYTNKKMQAIEKQAREKKTSEKL